MNQLITIPFSHFCEKARWGLDWCQVQYVERAYLPGLHLRHTKKLGGRTVPAFVPDGDATALVDSTEILQWADAQAPAERRLYPAEAAARAEADAIEEELDTGLGPATRLWAYAHGLRDRPLLRAMVAPSFPRWRDRALLALALPAIGPLIAKQYGARPEAVAGAEAAIEEGFAHISARLERQPYLGGARFGAADLTFATLGGALLLLPENRFMRHDVPLPQHMRTFVDRMRATPAGKHAARCYREHRR
jgi:glutathione S-transferase